MMKEYKGDFVAIGLDCKGAKQNFLDTSTNVARMTSFHIDQLPSEDSKSWTRRQWDAVSTFLEENRQNIFYLFVFYVVTIALFVERFIREHLIELEQRKSVIQKHIKVFLFRHL
jgi:dual oxidase